MKPWVIVLIVFVAILAIGISVWLYQQQRTRQEKVEAEKLALIYGSIALVKPVSPFANLLNTIFGGLTGILSTPAGQAAAGTYLGGIGR